MERAMAGADTGILDCRCPEPSGFAEVWVSTEENSIGNDGVGQRRCDKGNKGCFIYQGFDDQ
jgi:hypothetical protein